MPASDRPLAYVLAGALVAVGWLARPFLGALVVGLVVTLLAWPVHVRVIGLFGRRRRLATLTTMVAMTLLVFLPVSGLVVIVARELLVLANEVVSQVQVGDWDELVRRLVRYGPLTWLVDAAGGRSALIEGIEKAIRDGALTVAATVTQNVPGLLSVTAGVALRIVVFLLTVATLLQHGPEILAFGKRMSPLEGVHTERMYAVFSEFARNVVFAGLVCGVLQGIVATIGYALAGVDRVLLFGVLTAVFAYVPLVGTAMVWIPLSVLLLAQDHPGGALFVVGWNVVLTSSVDNLVRPFIVRGRSDVPLLLVFLGAFGGLTTFGVVGILVGPVLMAMVLALLRIWVEERGRVEDAARAAAAPTPGS